MTYRKTIAFTVVALAATGCAIDTRDTNAETESYAAEASALSAASPLLDWVLLSHPGVVRLAQVDPSSGAVNVVASHSLSPGWEAGGVAGELLLTRDGTTDFEIHQVKSNGNLSGRVKLPWFYENTGSARTIALDEDGSCPIDLQNATYSLVWDKNQALTFLPMKVLQIDAQGNVLSTNDLPRPMLPKPTRWSHFRSAGGGLYMSLHEMTAGDGGYIGWYGRDIHGDYVLLRRDEYSGPDGYVDCKPFHPGVSCSGSFQDPVPGAGYRPTSLLRTFSVSGSYAGTYMLWTDDKGKSRTYGLSVATGKLLAPLTTLAHGSGSAVSFSSLAPNVCPIEGPAGDPPDGPEEPVVTDDDCPICN